MPNGYNPGNGQHEINDGQRHINGQLIRVDMLLVETIKLLRLEMAKFQPRPGQNFEQIDKLLMHAYAASANISSIKPPGCEPSYSPDPNWTI